MAANYQALQIGEPIIASKTWKSSTTANTKSDGTGTIATDMLLLYTADATYGGYVSTVRILPQGSVVGTTTQATVARIYLSSQAAGATTDANTWLLGEVTCGAVTIDNASRAVTPLTYTLNMSVPAGYNLLVSMHHAAATSTSWGFTALAGDYTVVP